MAAWVLPAITAATGALNTGGTLMTNRSNRQMGSDQREHELKMWHMTNEYNSPIAQMERLRAAGLSPHLATPGSNYAQQPVQTPDEPEQNPLSDVLPYIQVIAQMQQTRNDNLKTQAEIRNINADTHNKGLYELHQNFAQDMQRYQYNLNRDQFGLAVGLLPYQQDLKSAQAYQARNRAALFAEQVATSKQMTPAQLRRINAEIQNIMQNYDMNIDLHEYNVQHRRAEARIREFEASDDMLDAVNRRLMAEIERAINQSFGTVGGAARGAWNLLKDMTGPNWKSYWNSFNYSRLKR